MAQFLLLLRHPQLNSSDFSPAVFEEVVAHMQAWREQLCSSTTVRSIGRLKSGEGKVVRTADGLVTDGPYSETKEILGGFFLIEVETEAAAVEIAQGCPILSFGGSVEVRPLEFSYVPVS